MKLRSLFISLCMIVLTITQAGAVNPGEKLDDPALEQRARDISANLRCLVCQNQSIDDSNADLAQDLRLLVRERLTKGDTNDQIMDYVVDRYGEFVLLRPQFSVRNFALWGTPIAMLLFGGAFAFFAIRQRRRMAGEGALSAEEEARLAKLIDDQE